jgi:glycerophosphoryl diester phosphodiesterase
MEKEKKMKLNFGKKMLLFTAAVMTSVVVSPFTAFGAVDQMEEHGYRVETVAHRGGAGHAPENTMSAFHNAFEMKADYLELDVHVSKDGELVVIHDPTVDRTTNGTGYVKDLTLEELKNLDAGSSFAPEFAGEKIPTLSEVLDEFRGKIGILIEIKAPLLYPDIEEKIADELIKRNMHKPKNEKIIVQGFYHPSVKEFHELLPEVPVGVLTQSNDELTDEALEDYRTYADYVNPVLGTVTPELIERIHGVGMKTMAWTVGWRPEQVQPLLEARVDVIITDYIDWVPRK